LNVRRGHSFRQVAVAACASRRKDGNKREACGSAMPGGNLRVYSAEASGLAAGASGSKPKTPTRYL
jgi:hypothetical protein